MVGVLPRRLLEIDSAFLRERYLDLLDTHPDMPSDGLADVAWGDAVEKALREFVCAQPAHNTPAAIRDTAVWSVDARLGYTMEFAPDPEAHAQLYDEEEERLREVVQHGQAAA